MKISDIDTSKYQRVPTIKNVMIYRTTIRKKDELVENRHPHHTLKVTGGKASYEIPPGEYREFAFGTAKYDMSWIKAPSTGNAYLDGLKDV